MSFDKDFAEKTMRRCFHLAQLGKGKVKTNPPVGAVIIHNKRVLGEGYHQKIGEAHAEVNAIESVKEVDKKLLSESDIYVSLEPCNHFGRTPPCTELLIKHKFKRVFISCKDPNPQINGNGVQSLKSNGIEVHEAILECEGKNLIREFEINQKLKRPYIILKYAQSKQGYMGKEDESVWFSNTYSRALVHKWRSEVDGILVGANTAALDNPELNVRFGFSGNPCIIVLDRKNALSRDLNLFSTDAQVIIVTEMPDTSERTYFKIPFDDKMPAKLLAHLFDLDIASIIIEGGSRTIKEFIKAGLWDEARIIRTSKNLDHGLKAPNLQGRLVFEKMLLDDQIICIKNKETEF